MLNEQTKQEIRDKLSAISTAMPDFVPRPAQRIMIAEVAKTLARCPDPGTNAGAPSPGTTVCVVQGGTGTGKSLGYGLTGMIMAKKKGKKLILSSSTIALQEQLVKRDLPFFKEAAGLDVKIALAKGRTRYVCQYKLAHVIGDMQQASMFDREERAGADVDPDAIRASIEEMAQDYADGKWDGDRDTRAPVSDDVWKAITADRHSCLNRACPSFKSCAQMAARARLRDADVIVTNHDLLLANLAMGGGMILPKLEDSFLIIDEAHGLPEKAVGSFAASHFVNAERRSAEKMAKLAASISDTLGSAFSDVAERIHDDSERLAEYLGDIHAFFSSVAQLQPTKEAPRPTMAFEQSCLPDGFFEIGENIQKVAGSLVAQFEGCLETVSELMGSDRSKQALYEKLTADIGFYLGRLEEVSRTWELFLETPAEDAPPVAKWIEATKFKATVDYQINSSPVVAAGYLKRMIWEKAAGVVLTSATITTMGKFDDFIRRVGLSGYDVPCFDLPSPFDYAAQGVIEIPNMPSPKNNYEGHTAAVTERLIADMSAQGPEGMLVLFTSRRQMEDVAARVPALLRDRIFVQGEQSKAAIIEAHCARVDQGLPSVIFGLASFTEGVDLPAKHCTQVVITKLPFAVPDTPVLTTLSDWIESRGGNPFMEIAVPDTARKLQQAVGRLIRTERDTGRVVITDPRIWTSRYGRAILRGLPPFRLIAMGKEQAA